MRSLIIIFLQLLLVSISFSQSKKDQIKTEDLKYEIENLNMENKILTKKLDSISTELEINRQLSAVNNERAMDTLEYASKIIDWSAWILAIIGILFITIGSIIGYFGFRGIRSFHKIRKQMSEYYNSIRDKINEVERQVERPFKDMVNIVHWSIEGWIKYINGNYYRAEYLFKKIKEIRPNDYGNYYIMGKVYSAIRKYNEANKEFEQAIKIDPQSGDAYFGLGWNYKNQKEYNKAIEAYKKGLKVAYGSYGLCGLGHVYFEVFKFKEAKDCFLNSIAERPNSGSAFPLANIFLFESNQELANQYYKKTLDFIQSEMIENPDYFWAYYNKIGAEMGLNKIDEAKKSLEIALKKNAGIETLKNMLLQFESMKKTNMVSSEIEYFVDRLEKELNIREVSK